MWLVESGIANLLSVPQLEADGFKVDYSNNLLMVTTPEGHVIPFKKDTGKCRLGWVLCGLLSYIND